MDTPQLTHISLCAGYGGIDLGLRRVLPSLRTIAYSEIEEYACGLLAARMESGHLDPAPIWSDLKTFPFRDFHGCVDILSGGYPCQPFSAAGKRRGTDDPRHLWPFIADGIRLCQPAFCFFENVEGHISLGLQDVLGDLADLGYRATWGLFSAAEVGAPHQRKRVFILAHRLGAGLEGYSGHVHHPGWQSEGQAGSTPAGNTPRMAHASGIISERFAGPRTGSSEAPGGRASNQSPGSDDGFWPSLPREPQHGWEPPRVVADRNSDQSREKRDDDGKVCSVSEAQCEPKHGAPLFRGESATRADELVGDGKIEPSLGRDINGPAGRMDYADLSIACHNRTDELRLLGNGVVPATAERAFRTLYARLFP